MKMPRFGIRYSRMQTRFGMFWPVILGSGMLTFLFFSSVLMYMYLESWDFWDSMYMVVITLSTVGYGEVHELSKAGEIFTSMLILMGVGAFMFMAGSVAQLLVEGKLHQVLRRRRVQKSVDRLSKHIIICGYGRIGSVVAKEMQGEGKDIVVLESDPAVLEELENDNILHLGGDATSDEILLAAGIERASSLITALSKEAANVYVVLTARQLNPKLNIVSRADNASNITRLERAGANRVVLPHTIGGMRMAQTVLRPEVTSFMELAVRGKLDLQMEELTVTENSELVHKDLIQSEIRPRFNIIIIGVRSAFEEMIFNPSPNHVLQAGDKLLAVGGKENLKQLQKIL